MKSMKLPSDLLIKGVGEGGREGCRQAGRQPLT